MEYVVWFQQPAQVFVSPKISQNLLTISLGFLLNLLAKDVVLDSAENVKVIQASDLEWTVVRYPRLMDGEHTHNYQIGFVGKESGTQLSRADGADFMLKELTEKRWLRKLPLVSY